MALAELLFCDGHQHVSAENLFLQAQADGLNISLATIYNTLHQFEQAGLLREIAIDTQRSYFDTNTSNHSHFYCEQTGQLIDICDELHVEGLPEAPAGTHIKHIDVLVRLAPR